MAAVGEGDAVIARELPDGSLELIDGHLRADTTPEATVPVLVLDVTEEEADKLLVTIDPLAAMATTDPPSHSRCVDLPFSGRAWNGGASLYDRRMTAPLRIMIVGASTNREKYGNKAVRAFARQGHEVFPVNPRAETIEGFRCYHAIADVPGPIDRASLYLPPELGLDAVRDLAARGDVRELWVNPGAESPALIAEARRLGFKPILACSIVAIGERP